MRSHEGYVICPIFDSKITKEFSQEYGNPLSCKQKSRMERHPRQKSIYQLKAK